MSQFEKTYIRKGSKVKDLDIIKVKSTDFGTTSFRYVHPCPKPSNQNQLNQ